jgi:hypothetical protein
LQDASRTHKLATIGITRNERDSGIVFITQTQRAELRERGYSDDDIAQMKPADAHRIPGLQ